MRRLVCRHGASSSAMFGAVGNGIMGIGAVTNKQQYEYFP